MTRHGYLFDDLEADLRRRLSHPRTGPDARRWAQDLPMLEGCGTAWPVALVASAASPRPALRRAVLGRLVEVAGDDSAARETAFAAVLTDLRVVAAQLTRAWRADPDEVDQAFAAAGWERLGRVAGRRWQWPDRVVVGGARDMVRDGLRRDARSAARSAPAADVEPPPATAPELDQAAGLIADAVARGVVTPRSARLVWVTRVLGVPATVVAGEQGGSPKVVVMRRLRAERALRRDRLVRAGLAEAG